MPLDTFRGNYQCYNHLLQYARTDLNRQPSVPKNRGKSSICRILWGIALLLVSNLLPD